MSATGEDHQAAHVATTRSRPTEESSHGHDKRRRRAPTVVLLVHGLAVTLMLAVPVQAGAVSGGSISPTKLTSSGQKFEVTYAGRTTKDQGGSVVVEECIADDRKADFDPTVDCSSLSRQSFYGVPESGTVTYGGNPTANPTAPFVGTDPENGQWSLCGTEAGVTNHDRGFFRISESPSDLTTDFFVPFTCAAAGAQAGGPATESSSRSTDVVLIAAAGAVALALIVWSARKRQKSKSVSTDFTQLKT